MAGTTSRKMADGLRGGNAGERILDDIIAFQRMGAFLSTSGRVRQKRGEGLQISRHSRRRAGYVVASRSVGRFCCRRVSRENDRVGLGRRQGKDRQKVKERNAGVWQVS